MSQIEPTVLTALTAAAKNAALHPATAVTLKATDVGSNTATAHRDALVAALFRRPSPVTKDRNKAGETLPAPPASAQVEIWSLYADHVDAPFLRGHLHHLLLDASHGRRPDHIRGAAAGYLDTVQLLLAAQDDDR
ncbi:hypothetical protein ACFUT3_33255 [Streptomyces cinereoruber]|uniref:hypothetical protein n=1 Tax=Streptomyces cinereoruber TaxID=67260 RepID=UPI00362C9D7B